MAARNIDATLWYVASLVAADLANEAASDAKTWLLVPGVKTLSEPNAQWSMADTTSRDSEVETSIPTTRKHTFNASIVYVPGNTVHQALLAAGLARTAIGLLMSSKPSYTTSGAMVVAGQFHLAKAVLQWSDEKQAQMLEIEAVPVGFDASTVAPVLSFVAT